MKLTGLSPFIFLALDLVILSVYTAPAPAQAFQTTLQYDPVFDNPDIQLSNLACSDGQHGLITRYEWHTLRDIPSYPHVGGSYLVGWNSPECGSCWKLTYTDGNGHARSTHVSAVDRTSAGFTVGVQAMNEITGGNAVGLGRVVVNAEQVATSKCGLP
ncbi:hypothetical protein D9758_001459 [Tetrapyrgos nigripes]|uniref:Uncharacterized protein n=1 Tax=Tetrapyrgos nigripes TaxID=182062 RepID=A0A8H5LXF0_9AGAR|nr:hypothetical protein D9758_001459 [Tetrapyrgos nigripes]